MICNHCHKTSPDDALYCCYCGRKRTPVEITNEPKSLIHQSNTQEFQLHPEISSALAMRSEEKILISWKTSYSVHITNKQSEDENHRSRGPLIATNQRLIYLEKKGFLTYGYKIKESIEHEQMKGSINVQSILSITDFIKLDVVKLTIEDQESTRDILFWNICEVDPSSLNEGKVITPAQFRSSMNTIIAQRFAEDIDNL